MTGSKTHHPTRGARIASRLAVLVLPAMLAMGCSDDSDGPPAATATPTTLATATATRPAATSTPVPAATLTPTGAPNASVNAACQKLAGCEQCFSNQYGNCLGTEECAPRLSADVAICINALTGCDQQALGDCLFLGCTGDATGECG